jgi:hypothetical protein
MTVNRARLPNRRPCHTESLEVDGQTFEATVGFDPQSGQPREIFLSGGKQGSMMDSLLNDAAVIISVALQHSISIEALVKSVGRVPSGMVAPADLDRVQPGRMPASTIGAALDLLRSFESGAIE